MRFSFPGDLSPPSVDERKRFYEQHFDIQHVRDLYYAWSEPRFVMDLGTETTLYRPRFKDQLGEIVELDDYAGLEELQDELSFYAPEDLYYDLRTYDHDPRQSNVIWQEPTGRQLVFVLRPELIECERCERRRRQMDGPEEMVFCNDCFADLTEQTSKLAVFLERHFDTINIYFTGRGFQILIKDQAGFDMSEDERRGLAVRVGKRFPIVESYTAGGERYIRLPGSINGLTGRKVIKLSVDQLEQPDRILNEYSEPGIADD